MKTQVTLILDDELVPKAERYASDRGLSLSELVESSLRLVTEKPDQPFSLRWRGHFRPAERDDERYRSLAKRYL
jgi:Family of unknown function (DUF6364)